MYGDNASIKLQTVNVYGPPLSEQVRKARILNRHIKQTNSGALVRQRTLPTERTPLVGEVSANFSG
jgi:hypothetical protein